MHGVTMKFKNLLWPCCERVKSHIYQLIFKLVTEW